MTVNGLVGQARMFQCMASERASIALQLLLDKRA